MLLTRLFTFVLQMTSKYGIDESHGLSHSMNVLNFANNIYKSEMFMTPSLMNEKRSIYVSAVLHDMCDKKYMNEDEGVQQIEDFLKEDLKSREIDTIKKIITTMSYSKVKVHGFPEMATPEKQLAYHIVREADLLSAYDFDRCMIYHMKKGEKTDILSAYENAYELFNTRVLKHLDDELFVTEYSKIQANILHNEAVLRMHHWSNILQSRL